MKKPLFEPLSCAKPYDPVNGSFLFQARAKHDDSLASTYVRRFISVRGQPTARAVFSYSGHEIGRAAVAVAGIRRAMVSTVTTVRLMACPG